MSQHFSGPVPERDCNDSSAFVVDHNDDGQEYEYASPEKDSFQAQTYPYTVPFHQPIVDHDHTLLSQQIAQTNGSLPLAQREHDSGPQYPAQYFRQTNPWNAAPFDIYCPGSFNPDVGLHHDLLDLSYDAFHPEPAFPMSLMASTWDFNSIQNFDQLDMPMTAGAQLIPASYQAMVSAPPAPVPAPAAVNRIHCPHGCQATFGRGGEYRRHMMIHERPRYRCPMVDCPKTFSRADKLRDHAKRGHGGHNPLNL